MATRVAINGFGRIGRAFFRLVHQDVDIEIVAINDLADPENLAYLLAHDSVYHGFGAPVSVADGKLVVGEKTIPLFSEKDPAQLPWGALTVDVVVESTGAFTSFEKASAHLTGGARRVVITAPVKEDAPADGSGATVLMGINDEVLKTCTISSNASCTTNAGSPLIAILDEALGIERALLNTVHGYTSSQSLVDGPHSKDPRRGRAAALNIVPSSTGAAIATTKAFPKLAGKFDGIAFRVPVPVGSVVDVTFVSSRATSIEEVNSILTAAALTPRWQGIFTATSEPIVSSDIVGTTYASIADLSFTRVADGTLVKVLAWYDNEMGYSHTLVEHVKKAGAALV